MAALASPWDKVLERLDEVEMKVDALEDALTRTLLQLGEHKVALDAIAESQEEADKRLDSYKRGDL